MPLLELDSVCKSFGRGIGRRVVLHDVNLRLEAGELVVIWGVRRSGRSTLLRLAAGLEQPDRGSVRFAAGDLAGGRAAGTRDRIAFYRRHLGSESGGTVFDRILESQVVRGAGHLQARARSHRGLERAGALHCGPLRPAQLDGDELTRVAIARALACEPELLVIDDPLLQVEPESRDEILALLRGLAAEGLAVLANTDRAMGLAGADRALALGEGTLRGETTPELAEVLQLRPASSTTL